MTAGRVQQRVEVIAIPRLGVAAAPAAEHRLEFVPVGVLPGREGLADARLAVAQADVAVVPAGVGELGEAPVSCWTRRLLNTFSGQSPPAGGQDRGPSGRVPENRSIYNRRSRPGGSAQIACCMLPPALRHAGGLPGAARMPSGALLRVLPRRGEVAAHDLGVGVVGAQHPQPVGQGLLVQRDGPAQVPRRRADRSAERSASDA